jgi:flagellar biosynthesis component FlhA
MYCGCFVGKKQEIKKFAERANRKQNSRHRKSASGLSHIDPMELEIGFGLIALVDVKQGEIS